MATIYRCDKCGDEHVAPIERVEFVGSSHPSATFRGDFCQRCWRRLIA